MTTRRWMVVVLAVAIVLWMGIAALRMSRESVGAYHRHGPRKDLRPVPGHIDLTGITHVSVIAPAPPDRSDPDEGETVYHRTPLLSRYWRHLLGRAGSDGYVCPATDRLSPMRGPGNQPLLAGLAAQRFELILVETLAVFPKGDINGNIVETPVVFPKGDIDGTLR